MSHVEAAVNPAPAPQPAYAFLGKESGLATLPLAPETTRLLPLPAQPAQRPVARAWNRYGGLLEPVCARLDLDVACALAVLCAESGGSGFAADGRLKIRLEAHLFRRELQAVASAFLPAFAQHFCHDAAKPWLAQQFRPDPQQAWVAIHSTQSREWEALEFARAWCEPAALRATSMGAPQILGANHAVIGYAAPRAMLDSFAAPETGERAQLLALFDFLQFARPQQQLLARLRERDFVAFARLYNGPGQAQEYARRIEDQAAIWRNL